MAARMHRNDEKAREVDRLALDEAARLRPNGWSSTEVRVVNLPPTDSGRNARRGS